MKNKVVLFKKKYLKNMSLVIIEKYLNEKKCHYLIFFTQRVIQNNLFYYNLLYFIISISF